MVTKPIVVYGENGSIFFEWNSERYKFGIVIDKVTKESGWYFASTENRIMEYGYFPEELLKYFKKKD